MSVQTEPVPPVPEHTPPLKEDDGTAKFGKYFNHAWTRWFISLREKVNIISASLVNLGDVSGNGILAKNGDSWFTRSIEGTAGKIDVANGDGIPGNPVVNLIPTGVTPGSYTNTNLTVDADGRLTSASNGSGGGGGGLDFYQKVLLLNPVAYYRMNELSGTTLADSSGNGLDATIINPGDVTLGTPGMVAGSSDTCITFGGTNGYAVIGQPAELSFGATANFTVFAIASWGAASPASSAVLAKASTSDRLVHVDTSSGNVFFQIGGTFSSLGGGTLNANVITNKIKVIAVTTYFVNSTYAAETWANGQIVARMTPITGNTAAGIDWLIGARRTTNNSNTGNYMKGRLQHIAIFDRTLSEPELLWLSAAVNG